MFLNAISITLSLCSLIALLLGGMACLIAVRVLRFWDPSRDDSRQIRLESEIWLSSTLVQYGLASQIITLVLFVYAADSFCQMIVGAMCATGALLANDFGMPALLLKLASVFFYSTWIVLHRLDISCETYPLVRLKYLFLLLLMPLLLLDITLQTLYIAKLKPDIITSCCAVVFGASQGEGRNLLGSIPQPTLLFLFYSTIVALSGVSMLLIRRRGGRLSYLHAGVWLFFFVLALVTITTVFSSYIYAMPFHRCPFCLFKPEYHYIGLAIFGTLIPAAVFGIAPATLELFRKRPELTAVSSRMQVSYLKISLILLWLFSAFVSYHYLAYLIVGGES